MQTFEVGMYAASLRSLLTHQLELDYLLVECLYCVKHSVEF